MATTGAKPHAEDLAVSGTIQNETACALTDMEWHRQWGSTDPSKIKMPPKNIDQKGTATFYFCGAPATASGATGDIVYRVNHPAGTFIATIKYDVPWGKSKNTFSFTVTDEGKYFTPKIEGDREGKVPTPVFILEQK